MKIIKSIFFILLSILLIAGTALFLFFQTFDADQYLPQITKKASAVLGRQLNISHLGLGLSLQGISLDAGPLSVADDTNFTDQPFMTIERVRVELDPEALILKREIHVKDIIVQSPEIHIIRSMQGTFNVQSLGRSIQLQPVVTPNPVATSPAKAVSLPNGTVKGPKETFKPFTSTKLIIADAAFSYIDQNQNSPMDIWLNGVTTNALIAASAGDNKKIGLDNLTLDIDLSQLSIDKFKGFVQVNLSHLDIDSSGNIQAKGDISIIQGVIKDFNIFKMLISQTLGDFGGLEGNIGRLLNGSLKEQLDAPDTAIEEARVFLSYHDKSLFIDDSLIKTNVFELTAKGSMDPALNVDMQTMLHLNQDLTTALTAQFKGFKSLCDDTQRIAIGASLQGTYPHLKYKPNKDFKKKSKKALLQEGGNILGVLLGGV